MAKTENEKWIVEDLGGKNAVDIVRKDGAEIEVHKDDVADLIKALQDHVAKV